MKAWFDSKAFASQYHTDTPLGAICQGGTSLFSLWAPTAEKVTLRLFADDTSEAMESHPLSQGEKGVWTYKTPRDLNGIYYDYLVTVDGITRRTQDPYATACGCNGIRSMVLAPGSADPEGWGADRPPLHTPDRVIYELHIRDFSYDKAGGFPDEVRGKYAALTLNGTSLNGDGIHPTGLDYLKQLGVTHIQLLPIYDFGSVDETDPFKNYNWGYDPVNYNIPEGSYCSDPHRGQVRIRELKEMIAALHKNGFRVIMDVVYNHTYDLDSALFKTVPWYFYRQNPDGTPSNGSGCGNDVATERSMCARYILDSVLYWAKEYHMDGFRFDLMGLMDRDLMNRIRRELDREFGPGEKLIYGEPWRAGDTNPKPETVLCDKGNLKLLDPGIGAFCDDTRDAVKGSVMDEKGVGFVNGGKLTARLLEGCVSGWSGNYGAYPTPAETLTYLSCHDDWTLWDKLVATLDPSRNFTALNPHILQANRLAAALNFCCQGNVFFLAGEEFGRTKEGVKNSYCSSSQINQLDWTRAWENRELVNYYQGLIALRMQLPALQDKRNHRLLWSAQLFENCAAVCLDNHPHAQWDKLLLILNCSDQRHTLSLPDGVWQVLLNETACFPKESNRSGSCTLPPKSIVLLGYLPSP